MHWDTTTIHGPQQQYNVIGISMHTSPRKGRLATKTDPQLQWRERGLRLNWDAIQQRNEKIQFVNCQCVKDSLAFLKQLSVDDARTWSLHAATQVVRDKTATNTKSSKKQK